MAARRGKTLGAAAVHGVLIAYTVVAIFPILIVLVNSVKTRRAIFGDPLAPPTPETFSLEGFATVLARSSFEIYFANSLIVTVAALFLVLLFGAMAAWALSEYRFPGNSLMAIYLAIGIMIPIRLGTIGILELASALDLVNTRTILVLVYTAQGLPLAVFLLSEFMRQLPRELKDAARCDGVSEYRIFFSIVLPLTRPILATVGIFTMIPIWNDLWFPLILAQADQVRTVTLGIQQFIGQYVTDWNAVIASLTLAILPVLALYLLFSRQLIRGLTSGAVK
jgi:raffinose/stachyose/melibiose transport system permease protein